MEKQVTGYKTAITRQQPSAPTKWLVDNYKLVGSILDYGCGKGFDATYYGFAKYDPYYYPNKHIDKYETIICNYVLNVVDPSEISSILNSIRALLHPNGSAYLTVRRDITKPSKGKDCIQYPVYIDLPIVKEVKNGYCIYLMDK